MRQCREKVLLSDECNRWKYRSSIRMGSILCHLSNAAAVSGCCSEELSELLRLLASARSGKYRSRASTLSSSKSTRYFPARSPRSPLEANSIPGASATVRRLRRKPLILGGLHSGCRGVIVDRSPDAAMPPPVGFSCSILPRSEPTQDDEPVFRSAPMNAWSHSVAQPGAARPTIHPEPQRVHSRYGQSSFTRHFHLCPRMRQSPRRNRKCIRDAGLPHSEHL